MFESYQKMYANLGRNPEFHKYADTLAEKVKIAAEQGVVAKLRLSFTTTFFKVFFKTLFD